MSGRSRRRKRDKRRKEAAQAPTPTTDKEKEKAPIVPWRQRTRELLRLLRDWARETHPTEIEDYFALRFGPNPAGAPVADLERAFDDFVFSPGTAEDGRSLLALFADAESGLSPEERREMAGWEGRRKRGVYLLERCHRDQMVLWDPLAADRVTVQLLERMTRGHAASLGRGTVVLATTLPYADRIIALGEVETWTDDEALKVFKEEVRESGRRWHELPPPAPTQAG